MNDYYFLNGEILPAAQAKVRINDIGILRGFAIFDFFRTAQGRPLMMRPYLQRFIQSAASMEMPLKYQVEDLENIVMELLSKSSRAESGIRLVLTGGYSENAFLPSEPNFMILIEPITLPPPEWFANGIKLLSFHYQREWSKIKTTNYLTAVKMAGKCREEGAIDVLYKYQGEWREVSRSNFFIVKNGVIITPDKDILFGITRSKVLQLARDHFAIEERAVKEEELFAADEAFMTGTTKKVLPVVRVDEYMIGNGTPGNVTQKLMDLFNEFEANN